MATLAQGIESAIEQAVRTRLAEIVNAESNKAVEAVLASIQKELGVLAMSVLKMYRVEMGSTEILIRVANETKR